MQLNAKLWSQAKKPEKVVSSIEAQRGTIILLFLFSLYNSDFQYDSVTSDDPDNWGNLLCHGVENIHLILNMKVWFVVENYDQNKVYFKCFIVWKTRNETNTFFVMGGEMEVVEDCRDLGFPLENRLDLWCETKVVDLWEMSKLYFL